MSVRDSLAQKYPDVLLTKQEGFVQGYDISIPSQKITIECKRHKNFSWNELEKYFLKLVKRVEQDKDIYPFLIFQANHQPCLVMKYAILGEHNFGANILVMKFEDKFEIPFIKHKGKKVKE